MSFSAGGDAGVGEVEGSGTGTGNSLGADLVRSMPGLGGCGAVVDPYGLASRGKEVGEEEVWREGTLGGWAGGFGDVRPGMLWEAYVNGGRYAGGREGRGVEIEVGEGGGDADVDGEEGDEGVM